MAANFFALDIGNHSIKIAELEKRGDGYALERIGSAMTTHGLLDDTTDAGLEKLADYIKKAKDDAQVTTANCVASVPESPIFSRLITVPKTEEDQMEDAVHWELKPLVPVPLEEVDIAFLEIAEKQVGEQKMVDVYAVAAPKTLTNQFKKLTEKAGLNLIALETESLANTRAIRHNYDIQGDFIICDLGAQTTDLILARSGVPIFSQTISTGSDSLTKVIAADFGIDEIQAEKYKRAFGLLENQGDGKIAKAIEPIMQIIQNEMQRTLAYFKEKVGDASGQNLYICGEAALLPGLTDHFRTHLNLESTIVNPLAKIEVPKKLDEKIAALRPVGFSVAVGLGIKEH